MEPFRYHVFVCTQQKSEGAACCSAKGVSTSAGMLVGTTAGSSYSEPEYDEWLSDAGFRDIRRIRLPGPSGLLVASKT